MIKLHRLNNSEISINAELIESIESIPDTKIILTTGNQFIVKESVDEVIEKIKEYRKNFSQKINSKKQPITETRGNSGDCNQYL
ncbi:MAG: flagellar FlbD family protein [Elusimicrobiota bacterium]|nr:flagellar FlbD family protein [Elusimicrobiota bacterium]